MGTVQNDVDLEPGTDVSPAHVEALLKSADWEARLEQARMARNKVLAERAKGGVAVDAMRGPRPWEMATTTDLAERRRIRAQAAADASSLKPAMAAPNRGVPAAVGGQAAEERTVAGTAVALVAKERPLDLAVHASAEPRREEKRSGSRLMWVGMAFAMGLGLGLGGVLLPRLLPSASQDMADAVPQAAVTVSPPFATQITDLSAPAIPPPAEPVVAAGVPAAVVPAPGAAPVALAVLGATPVAPNAPAEPAGFPAGDVLPVRAAALRFPGQVSGGPDAAPGIVRASVLRPLAFVPRLTAGPGASGAADAAILRPGDNGPGLRLERPAALPTAPDGPDTLPLVVSFTPADAPVTARYATVTLKVLSVDSADPALVSDLTEKVRGAGFAPVAGRPLTISVKKTHVRFYHSADAGAAAAAAASVGGQARDFTSMASPPPPGTVEVWISGKPAVTEASAKPATKTKKSTTRKASAPAQPKRDPVQALRDRIAAQLRNGDHL